MVVSDLSVLALTVQAIGFATGTALCLMLAHLWWTLERAAGRSRLATSLWLASSLWTGGSLAVTLLQLRGDRPGDRAMAVATAFAWSATALTPALVTRTLARDEPLRSRRGKVLLACSTASAAILVALFFVAALVPSAGLRTRLVASLSFASLVVHGIGWAVAAHVRRGGQRADARPPRLTESELFARSGLVLVAILIAMIGLTMVLPPGPIRSAAVVGSQQCAIVWAVRAAAFQARARYADLVLKRTLTIVAAVAASSLVVALAPGFPLGLPAVAGTMAAAAIMLASPTLFRGIGRFVDRVVLRRPDYRAAARGFADECRRSPDRQTVFSLAERHVHAVLGLPAVAVPVDSPGAGERLPIEGGYVLEVRRSAVGRGLMRDELVYLEGVATEVSHRLDSLAFESERRSLLLREERLRHSLTEAELKALRAQVDPHFLFNTLNTIADLISSDAATAEAMTEQLAEFFRYTLARQGPGVSTLEQEFEFVRRYLAIEQVSFGDRLSVELRCEPSVARHPVPALLLQPLVENAIRHRLALRLNPGRLSVSAAADDRGIRISVEDDGVGMPPVKSGAGVGLRNVSDRIQAMYGSAARLEIASGARSIGTRVDIYMPLAAGETALAGTGVRRVIEP